MSGLSGQGWRPVPPGAVRLGREMRRLPLLLALAAVLGCGPASPFDAGSDGGPGGGGPMAWRFTEVGAASGLAWRHEPYNPTGAFDAFDHGGGVAASDFDGDGHADVLLLTQCGPTGYFLGRGDGTFEDRSERLSMLDDGVRVAAAFGDFDEDGRTDLFVTFTRRPDALLRQNPDGTFTDVAPALGVAGSGHHTGASFADVDGDGDLDLVVAANMRFTEEEAVPGDDRCPPGWKAKAVGDLFTVSGSDPSALYINGGPAAGWTFTEEGAARGLPPGSADPEAARGFGDVLVLDFDRDGDPDLLLPEMFRGKSALLENDGTGRFSDVTASRIPRPSFGASGAAADDFDGDGWPDVLMADMHSDMWAPTDLPFTSIDAGVRYDSHHGPHGGTGDNPSGPLFGNTLWMSAGGGTFTEEDLVRGSETFNPWGALADDFDNDGRVDVFVPSGMSNPWPYYPDVLLWNGGDRFVQRQDEVGLALPHGQRTDPSILVNGNPLVRSTRGTAAADFDEDGDLDLVCYGWRNRAMLWRNDLPRGNHWIDVDLRGRAPRDPFGAEVEVVAGGAARVRWMQAGRGYLSQSSRLVHVGLGKEREVESVTVRWPDGTSTVVQRPRADRRLVVEQ